MRILSTAVCLLMMSHFALAQEPKPAESEADARIVFMQQQAASIVGETSSANKIRALDKPLLRWTNPNTNIQDGVLACWVNESGVPVAAAQICLTPNSTTQWAIEFQSLSSEPLTLGNGVIETWSPSKKGITWHKHDQVGAPSPSEKRRLVQMRTLARKFRGDDNFENEESVLRLMTNPLVRYSDLKSGIVDGALFALVHGTDPEMLIMIEARNPEDKTNLVGNANTKTAHFYWALAPMTAFELRAYIDRKQVWHKPGMTSNLPSDIFFQRLLVPEDKAAERTHVDRLKGFFGF